jgi:hypothetical protein
MCRGRNIIKPVPFQFIINLYQLNNPLKHRHTHTILRFLRSPYLPWFLPFAIFPAWRYLHWCRSHFRNSCNRHFPIADRRKLENANLGVTYRATGRHRFGQYIPVEANAQHNRISVARHWISKHASLTIKTVTQILITVYNANIDVNFN